MIARQAGHVRLDEHRPKVMAGFVRNTLIDDALLPLFGPNLARQLGTVDVTSTRTVPVQRFDVHKACPNYAAALQDALSRQVYISGSSGEMKVTFNLKGNKVDAIRTQGGPFDYRRPMRRAVGSFDCASGDAATQQYSFLVVFKQEGESSDQQRVAVVEGQTLASRD